MASIWYINPKWVCPVLDFSSSYSSITAKTPISPAVDPDYLLSHSYITNSFHDIKTGRGLWGGYGTDPYDPHALNDLHAHMVDQEVMSLSAAERAKINKGIFFEIGNFTISSTDKYEHKSSISGFMTNANENHSYFIDDDKLVTTTNTGSLIDLL